MCISKNQPHEGCHLRDHSSLTLEAGPRGGGCTGMLRSQENAPPLGHHRALHYGTAFSYEPSAPATLAHHSTPVGPTDTTRMLTSGAERKKGGGALC